MARFRRAGFAGVVLGFLGAPADFVLRPRLSFGAAGVRTSAAFAAAAGLTARLIRERTGLDSGDSALLFRAILFRGLVFFCDFIGRFGFENGVPTVNQPSEHYV